MEVFMNNDVISINNLSKKFGDFYAVNNATFGIEGGRIHGFVGPNGAGKTTTMKMIMGSIIPTSGSGTVMGHEIGSVEAKKLLGYAPEFPSFYSDMTALEYLIYMASLGRVGYKEACYKAEDLLDSMGLRDHRDKKVAKFSTGMKKKVGLAQAMIHNPAIMLLDEPTANLDPTSRIDIIEGLKALVKDKNITLLISSHVLSELEQIITNVTLIDRGRIVKQGVVAEIGHEMQRTHYIIGTTNNARISELLYQMPFVISVKEVNADKIEVITDNPEELIKYVMTQGFNEKILINHFSEDNMSLENIYKNVFMEGGKINESNIQPNDK